MRQNSSFGIPSECWLLSLLLLLCGCLHMRYAISSQHRQIIRSKKQPESQDISGFHTRQRKMQNKAIKHHSKIEYSDLCVNIFGWWSTFSNLLARSLAWFAYARIFSIFFRISIEISETRIIGFFPLHARPASERISIDGQARQEEKKTSKSLWHNTCSLKEFTFNGCWN